MFKHIIVAVDFSEAGRRAIGTATRLAAAIGATVRLVSVIPATTEYKLSSDEDREPIRTGVERQLKILGASLLGLYGTQAHPDFALDWGVVDGKPAEEIVKFAQHWKGDLIVVGTSGRSGVARALLGSVADRIVRTATVPVMVVGPETEH